MIKTASLFRIATLAVAVVALLAPAAAQKLKQEPATKTDAQRGPVILKVPGVWVEGPGFEVTYGSTYEGCAQRCLTTPKCLMLEFYRPERKCNLYDTIRARIKGGSSDVGIRS